MRGHISRRGKHSWRLKFDIGRDPATGKRKIQFHTVRGSRRKAEAELAQLLSRIAQGTHVDPLKLTVADFLDRWQQDWVSANVSPKTAERYASLIQHQIRPHIGRHQIQKLRPIHLNELYGTLLREGRLKKPVVGEVKPSGLSPRTVGHTHRVLHRALGHAAAWGIIQQNPADNVNPPRVEDTEVDILREGEIKELLDKLRGRLLYTVALLALATGMRRGEMLALRWQDVDLDAGKIRVERSLEQTKAGGLRFKSPKPSAADATSQSRLP